MKKYGKMVLESIILLMVGCRRNAKTGPWLVTLKPIVYDRFMQHCPDRVQRWNAHHAHVTLSAAYIDQDMNHSITLEDVRSHRYEWVSWRSH